MQTAWRSRLLRLPALLTLAAGPCGPTNHSNSPTAATTHSMCGALGTPHPSQQGDLPARTPCSPLAHQSSRRPQVQPGFAASYQHSHNIGAHPPRTKRRIPCRLSREESRQDPSTTTTTTSGSSTLAQGRCWPLPVPATGSTRRVCEAPWRTPPRMQPAAGCPCTTTHHQLCQAPPALLLLLQPLAQSPTAPGAHGRVCRPWPAGDIPAAACRWGAEGAPVCQSPLQRQRHHLRPLPPQLSSCHLCLTQATPRNHKLAAGHCMEQGCLPKGRRRDEQATAACMHSGRACTARQQRRCCLPRRSRDTPRHTAR